MTTSTTGRPAARTIAVLVLGLVTALWSAGAAAAHVAPDVTIVSPEGGADVSGTDVVVALSASAEGSGPAQFTLHLDDQPVDASGRVGPGGAFTGLSLAPGAQLQVTIPTVAPGEHTLEVRFAEDGDHTKPTVASGFTVGGAPSAEPVPDDDTAAVSPTTAPGVTVTPTGDTGVGPAFIETRAAAPDDGSDGDGSGGGAVVAAVVASAAVMTALLLWRRRAARQR
ncbi:MAG TPA: Ig-like domain-containing protein [Mycobacteriales bacterium]|nr:Ig-like domain-containing protein [Mycobacteriales bacterium]